MKGYWNNLRPFEKRVFVGVMAMLFIVFNFWFVRPHFGDWAKVQTRMGAAQKKLTLFQTEINQKDFYEREIRKLQGEGLSVPPEEQSVQFLRAIQTQAGQSVVNVQTYGRQNLRTNDPFFLELSMNITTLCGEPQLVDFLYNLGSSNSLIRVRDLTLKPDVPRQQLMGQITLVASFQKKRPTAPVATKASAATPAKAPASAPAKTPAAAPKTSPTKAPTPSAPASGKQAATNKSPSTPTKK